MSTTIQTFTVEDGRTMSASITSETSPSSSDFGPPESNNTSSFIGNTPSTVLFFLALAVGVFIASLFVFFTIRYFIRSKYGLHIYPVSQRNFLLTTGGSSNIATMHHTTVELQEQLNYVRTNQYIRSEIFDRRLNLRRRRRRRRRGRFSKMKKLTDDEVEKLFPKKSYYDWLHGGQERDHENRDGVLQEEGDFAEPNPKIDAISTDESNANVVTGVTSRTGDPGDASGTRPNDGSGPSTTEDIELGDLSARETSVKFEQPTQTPQTGIEQELHFTSGSCAICLETIEDDDLVRGLVCGHVFHADCLDPWLTKRRACCPMCKRDYYYKGQTPGNNANDNTDVSTNNDAATTTEATIDGETTNNDDNNDSDIDSIDIEVFRTDPTLRAMLQELIPVDERVRMILNDETLSHLNLEVVGRETAKRKYNNIFQIIFWKIMGVSKHNLYNYGILTAYHDYRLDEERRLMTATREATVQETVDQSADQSRSETPQETIQTGPETIQTGPEMIPETDITEQEQERTINTDVESSNQTLRTAHSHLSSEESRVSPEIMRDVTDNRV